jgi:phosphatidylglycerophosphate synthase
LADALTTLRCVFVLVILYAGVVQGPAEGLATAALLTILAWVSDVLDGPLARRARRPTRLGWCDLVADLGLTLALATCLVAWKVLPLLLVAGGLALAGLGVRVFRAMAPLQFAMGLIYGTFIFTIWHISPEWGRALVGGVGLLVLLNPRRAWQQVTGFLNQAAAILGRTSPAVAQAGAKEGR